MPKTTNVINQASHHLIQAEKLHQSVAPITELLPTFTIDDAYHTQLTVLDAKLKQGAKIVGKKIGLTSLAMQQLLGVDQPDYGHLLDNMEVEHKGEVKLSTLFQPKIEGEIAFVLKEDLCGPHVTAEQVLSVTDYVAPSIEIVDSRIKNWQIKLEDTVADNASCGLYVLGDSKIDVQQLDLPSVRMQLLKNGEVVNEGTGNDVLGHPATCVAWLANKLHAYGVTLKKGEVILSGALSVAVEAKPGDTFTASFTELGEATIHFVE